MNEKQDVLKAILNVKKYAKALKRNATTIQEINFQATNEADEIASSPSFFEGKRQAYQEDITSPVIFSKSSFGDAVASYEQKNQKKGSITFSLDFSMTILPKKRDILQRNELKLKSTQSNQGSESRNSSINKSARSQQLSHSSKFQFMPSSQLKPNYLNLTRQVKESKNRSFQKKTTQLELKESFKNSSIADKSIEDEQASQTMFQIQDAIPNLNRRRSHNSSTNPGPFSSKILPQENKNKDHEAACIQNPEFVGQLLGEIKYLKGQLVSYKHAFMIVKEKYLEIEGKAQDKAQNDHLIDILKLEISELQQNNERLTHIIEKQNCQIRNFSKEISNVCEKIMNFYAKQTESLVKIETQNEHLRQLINLKHSFSLSPSSHSEKQMIIKGNNTKDYHQEMDVSSQYSQSQSQGEGIYLDMKQICKNEMDLKKKYEEK